MLADVPRFYKDLLEYVSTDAPDEIIGKDMIKEAVFVPESKSCSEMFRYMTAHKTQVAVVVDEFGDGLIGATILQDGKGIATTDMDGNFSVVVEQGAPLTFRYIGYTSQTWPAQNGMRVTLEEEKQMLESVEVVAYGVQKKVTVTGALSSLKSDDLVRTPVSSVNNVLAGQLSGVTTVQYSGEPGSDAASIFVRGQGTWNDSSPLVQVDGVERSMSDIDPEDIESITVLKDASATAVFGVRGANGVVLITTKRGAEGKAKIVELHRTCIAKHFGL